MPAADGSPSLVRPVGRSTLYFWIGALGCLYLKSFVLPHTPIVQGDSSPIFLLEAARMLRGEVIYRDFFEFVLPGTPYTYLAFFKLFGMQAWIPSVMFVLLGAGLAWSGVAIAKHLVAGKYIFLPSLLFLGFAFISESDPTHHWYSSLAVMLALVVLIDNRSPARLAAAGLLCGLAALFTQNRGVSALIGIACYLLWEWKSKEQDGRALLRAQAFLLVPFLVPILAAVAYFVSRAGLEPVFNAIVIFPVKYFHLWYWNTSAVYLTEVPDMPFILELPALGVWFSIHLLLPLVYLLFLVRWWQRAKARPEEPWDRLMLLTIVGLFLFVGVAFSASWLRLCSVSLPAMIVFVWFVKSSGKPSKALTYLLWAVGAAIFVGQSVIAQVDWRASLNTPAGRVAFQEPDVYEKFQWLRDRTRPGDYIWQASDCSLYYLLHLQNPAPVSFVTATGYTRPEQVRDVVAALERSRPQFVLWTVWLDVPRFGSRELFDFQVLAPIRAYLRAHYHLVRSFGAPDYEQVWERNP